MNFSKLLFFILFFSSSVLQAQQLAFPGAEGFGRFATGGRGGAVYHVTNLDDSGPGSFRDAVSQPGRIVVFDVGGVINTAKRIIVSPNITIAGQTAPGDGITIYGNGMSYTNANNSITRYIRVRMGIKGDKADAVSIATGSNMIFDHLSVSWGRDETFSMSGIISDVTIQNCIISEGLHSHSAGGLIQTTGGVSLLKNLYINNHTRNPKVKGKNQFVNNVIYNWRVGAYILGGGSEGNSYASVKNNYFIDGPQTASAPFTRGNENFHIFAAANYHDANKNGKLDGNDIPKEQYTVVDWQAKDFDYPVVTMLSPEETYNYVVKQAGASKQRDAIDTRLVNTLRSLGAEGKIIASEAENPEKGPGVILSGKSLKDTDQDGMPDSWEKKNKLNYRKADGNGIGKDGYTNIERYLNELADKD